MRMADLFVEGQEKVERDGDFEIFGMVGDGGGRLCVPVSTEAFLATASSNPNVVAMISSPDLAGQVPDRFALAVSQDPMNMLYRNHQLRKEFGADIHIRPNRIAATAQVHPAAYIAETGVTIGDHAIVSPLAVVEPGTVIGNHAVIGPGVVLGGNGFEIRSIDGEHTVVWHAGGVSIGDHAEIMSNTVVVRALFGGFTRVGAYSVVDNLCHIAHNVTIGERCKVVACVMLGGSSTIEDGAWVGPNSTISNGLTIGQGASVTLGAVATRDVPAGQRVSGNFAVPHSALLKWVKSLVSN